MKVQGLGRRVRDPASGQTWRTGIDRNDNFYFVGDKLNQDGYYDVELRKTKTNDKESEEKDKLTTTSVHKRAGYATGGLTTGAAIVGGRASLARLSAPQLKEKILQVPLPDGFEISPEAAGQLSEEAKRQLQQPVMIHLAQYLGLVSIVFGIRRALIPDEPIWDGVVKTVGISSFVYLIYLVVRYSVIE